MNFLTQPLSRAILIKYVLFALAFLVIAPYLLTPLLFAVVLLFKYDNSKKLNAMAVLANAKTLQTQAAGVLVAFTALGFLIAKLSLIFIYSIKKISTGDFINGYVGLVVSLMLFWLFFTVMNYILERKQVMNILKIASDPQALNQFLSGNALPQITINATELEAQAKQIVIGQERVIKELSQEVSRRAKLNRANKPLGVYMFVGATGTGKTELAKAIADIAFESRLVRFDMNEFTQEHSSQRLIGSPAGYIGSDQGGALTQAIFTNKSGVLLFDEIEKAHSNVLKMLMGLLDEGRITEQSSNRVANASRFIIILTSNAAHEELAKLAETISDTDDLRRAVKDTLRTTFKAPEILARLDEIFCFKKLDRFAVAQIVGKFLDKFAREAGVEIVKVDNQLLIETILKHEKNSEYGIRELARLLERSVLDGMLEAKEAGYKTVEIHSDGETISVKGAGNELSMS